MRNQDAIPQGLKLHHLGGTEVVAGRYRDHVLPRHIHDGLMLSLLSDGVQLLQYRGATHSAGPGTILAVPPNEVHAAEPGAKDGWYYHTVVIPTDVLKQHHAQGGGFFCDTAISDGKVKSALVSLFLSLDDAPVLQQEEALLHVVECVLTRHTSLPQMASHKPTELRAVETCKEYLAECLDRNVSLAELSQLARIDQYLLVRCFTNIVGMPPHSWHIQRRFHKSLDMLSKGETVADVAIETGFADQAHLTRIFKRMTGITPGRYRKGHLAFVQNGTEKTARLA